MTRLLLSLLLMLFTANATAATLDRDGMIGTWITPQPQSIINSLHDLFGKQLRDRLEIRADSSVKLTRQIGGGKEQVLVAPPSMVSFHEDIMIVKFPHGAGSAKLVLTGWSIKHSELLFGTLYLYDSNGLFNGIPVRFKPIAGS